MSVSLTGSLFPGKAKIATMPLPAICCKWWTYCSRTLVSAVKDSLSSKPADVSVPVSVSFWVLEAGNFKVCWACGCHPKLVLIFEKL